MQRQYLTVACGAFIGCCLGLLLYHAQDPAWSGMNVFGVLSLASLGTSCGCLLAEPGNGGDRQ